MAQGLTPGVRLASAIAYDSAGNLYIADAASQRIFEATLAGTLKIFAGSGVQGFAGDGGPATAAQFNGPQGLAVANDGTVYIADTGNHRVRAVDGQGQITTVAGTGTPGFSGDGAAATLATLRSPTALAMDPAGALLLCDTGNRRVRRVVQGVIATIAGSGIQGFAGDGGPALLAALDAPQGVTADAAGDIFIADTHNHRVRVLRKTGLLETFAGTGTRGFAGDGGAAVQAKLSEPRGLAIDAAGNLLIADSGNQRLRQVATTGVILSVVGDGAEGGSTDGAQALVAALRAPRATAVSGFGMPVVADTLNGAVRVLAGAPGLFLPAALATGRASSVMVPSAGPAVYGQASLGASVKGSVGAPQGGLLVAEAGNPLNAGILAGAQTGVGLPGLSAGTHTVSVQYVGDGLNPAAQTTATITVIPAPATATVNAMSIPYGSTLPAFSGSLFGILPSDSQDVMPVFQSTAGSMPAVGTYDVSVGLAGAKASNYTVTSVSTTGKLSVVKASSLSAAMAPSQAFAGIGMSVRATVASSTRGQPTGTVQFLDGGSVIATAMLQNGSASVTYPGTLPGSRQVEILYAGDSNFLPSSSTPLVVPVTPLPDFSVTTTGIAEAKVNAGATAKYILSVGSNPGPFTGAVSLSAAGLPSGANISFSPPQVVPGTQTAAVTVAVQTAATTASVGAGAWPTRPSQLCVGLVGLLFLRRGSRRRRRAAFCLLGSVLGLVGCGARTVSEGTGDLIAKTYTVQLTGTATNLAGSVITHSVPVTLTIQQ